MVIDQDNFRGISWVIRSRRVALKLSQEDLASKTGLTQAMVAHIESGKRIAHLPKLIEVLNILGLSLKIELKE